MLQQQGNTAQALEKAQQATYAEPSDAAARAFLDLLTNGTPPAKPPLPTNESADSE